jgi:hypothetical protein
MTVEDLMLNAGLFNIILQVMYTNYVWSLLKSSSSSTNKKKKIPPAFYALEGSLPCTQQPATCPHPQPDLLVISPRPSNQFPQDPF